MFNGLTCSAVAAVGPFISILGAVSVWFPPLSISVVVPAVNLFAEPVFRSKLVDVVILPLAPIKIFVSAADSICILPPFFELAL